MKFWHKSLQYKVDMEKGKAMDQINQIFAGNFINSLFYVTCQNEVFNFLKKSVILSMYFILLGVAFHSLAKSWSMKYFFV